MFNYELSKFDCQDTAKYFPLIIKWCHWYDKAVSKEGLDKGRN